MFKKYSKEVFLLILVSLLLISISAISAGDVSNSTTTSPTVTVEKQVSMSNVIKEDTTDNKVLSKNSENIQTKEKTDNKKTIKKETSNVDYYVCDNSGSDSNTGSQDSPFKTIGYAVGKVNSNDNYNIHIKNGTYKGTGNTNLTIDNNTPSTPLTPTKLKTKSIKTETITNDNYNQYFDENGVIKPSITEITLGSDLYNKNITINNSLNHFNNPNNYTLYNSTVSFKGKSSGTVSINNINIVNTDERESLIEINGKYDFSIYFEGGYLSQKNKTSDCTLITKNDETNVAFNNITINMESKKGTIFNNESKDIGLSYITLNMDCEEAMILNISNKNRYVGFIFSNITVKTKIATPIIIGNNSTIFLLASIVTVDEPSNESIIYLENTTMPDDGEQPMVIFNYLETPFVKGDNTIKLVNSEEVPVMGNIPSEENMVTAINTVFPNKLYKNLDNYINITVVDLFGNKINEGIVSVKINDTEIGTATVKDGLASIKYKPIETGNYTINVNYTCDSGKYAHLNWIQNEEAEDPLDMFSLEQVNTTGILEYADAVASITMNPIVSCLNNVINVSSSITFNGNNVNGGRVVFKVNGKTLKDADGNIQYVKVVDGKAVIENVIVNSNWLRQNPTITTVYSGNGIILGSTYTDIMNITKAKAHIELEPQTAEEKSQITITARIINEITNENSQTNNKVNGGRVIFKINGRTLKDSNNNVIYAIVENGVASITYTLPSTLKSKEYTLSCVYGHKLYERSEGNTTLTIVKS